MPSDLPDIAPRDGCPVALKSGWLAEENRLPGERLPTAGTTFAASTVSAYARTMSVGCGDTVPLAVSATPGQYVVRAWRVGDYGGAGARVFWTSPAFAATRQENAAEDVVGAGPGWTTTTTFPITTDWLPGLYILQIVGSGGTLGSGGWTPLIVTASSFGPADARPSGVYLAPTLTWAAYNPYGGASLYRAFTGSEATRSERRARAVAIGRPSVRNGQRQVAEYTVPLVQAIEAVGIDMDYLADTDVDAAPSLLTGRSLVVVGSHAEYVTTRLYDALEAARNAGTNLAFLGANQIYWNVRLTRASDGAPLSITCYRKLGEDPLARTRAEDATVRWRDRPLSRPEALLLGSQYSGLGIVSPLQALKPPDWTGWEWGQLLPRAAAGEVDAVSSSSPPGTQILAQGTTRVGKRWIDATVTYYVAPSGAAVVNFGSMYVGCLSQNRCSGLTIDAATRRAVNSFIHAVVAGFITPRFGATHPVTSADEAVTGAAFAEQHPQAVGRSLTGGDD